MIIHKEEYYYLDVVNKVPWAYCVSDRYLTVEEARAQQKHYNNTRPHVIYQINKVTKITEKVG